MPQTTTTLLAFKPPTVKGVDRVVLPVLTATGEWAELACTPALAREIAGALSVALGLARPLASAAGAAPAPAAPSLPRGSRAGVPPERVRAYLAAWTSHHAGEHRSFAAACRAHGVADAAAKSWLGLHAPELPALCAQHGLKAPLLKPGGRIL